MKFLVLSSHTQMELKFLWQNLWPTVHKHRHTDRNIKTEGSKIMSNDIHISAPFSLWLLAVWYTYYSLTKPLIMHWDKWLIRYHTCSKLCSQPYLWIINRKITCFLQNYLKFCMLQSSNNKNSSQEVIDFQSNVMIDLWDLCLFFQFGMSALAKDIININRMITTMGVLKVQLFLLYLVISCYF